jgi:hypothetical protein
MNLSLLASTALLTVDSLKSRFCQQLCRRKREVIRIYAKA